MLFSEPKIPQSALCSGTGRILCSVSVLFSEPKIPQSPATRACARSGDRFSALQRAENSSIKRFDDKVFLRGKFQCSSASRKFLNVASTPPSRGSVSVSVLFSEPKIPQSLECGEVAQVVVGFSALQRAENSSMSLTQRGSRSAHMFQCSSASRKFLNAVAAPRGADRKEVSVLFSEPKIPQ